MAKLILSLDDQVIKDFEISKERMTIGRKPHNDIQIDNLAVSGEHAMIMTILNDSFLEDLGSTNGTMVNGKAVKKHFLQPDDVVEIGKYKLRYINDKAGKVSQEEFEKTMVLRAPATAAPALKPTSRAGRLQLLRQARRHRQSAAHPHKRLPSSKPRPPTLRLLRPTRSQMPSTCSQLPAMSREAPATTQPNRSPVPNRAGRYRFFPVPTREGNCR
jgi:pSer/pThr/pTyr-binding forkhead associated (FHA) protein